MNIQENIRQLEAERDRITRVIETLKTIEQPGLPLRSRRGRKSMGAAERAEVSRRMRAYWANRAKMRKAKGAA